MREWMMSMTATVPMFSAMTTLLTVGDICFRRFSSVSHTNSQYRMAGRDQYWNFIGGDNLKMLNVAIILGSTRPGPNGEAVAKWVYDIAKRRTDATFELVDLRGLQP